MGPTSALVAASPHRPSSVSMPVARPRRRHGLQVTTKCSWPGDVCGGRPGHVGSISPTSLATGVDSPVRVARRPQGSPPPTSTTSAGTLSPASHGDDVTGHARGPAPTGHRHRSRRTRAGHSGMDLSTVRSAAPSSPGRTRQGVESGTTAMTTVSFRVADEAGDTAAPRGSGRAGCGTGRGTAPAGGGWRLRQLVAPVAREAVAASSDERPTAGRPEQTARVVGLRGPRTSARARSGSANVDGRDDGGGHRGLLGTMVGRRSSPPVVPGRQGRVRAVRPSP